MIVGESLEQYNGKKLRHFEDEDGNVLDSIYMEEAVVLVFEDGARIWLGVDYRGPDCYISQYEDS